MNRSYQAKTLGVIWLLGLAMMIGVTFPLWISEGDFPRVPWLPFSFSPGTALKIDIALLGSMLIAGVLFFRSHGSRWTWLIIATSLSVLVLLDQHRLQPWTYQFIVFSTLFACVGLQRGVRWTIPVAISVYFYSAVGKIDYQFVNTVGSEFVESIFGSVTDLSHQNASRLAFVFPAVELFVAVLLAISRTRRFGGILSIGMHLSLISLLGPWMLDHSLGVICWNGLLALQNTWLFVLCPALKDSARGKIDEAQSEGRSDAEQVSLSTHRKTPRIATGLVVAVLALPLCERWGYWDHWTSWALYSPHSSRIVAEIHRSAWAKLPDEAAAYLLNDENGDGWSELDLESWSLESRWVPIYPQARYQLAAVDALAEEAKLESAVRALSKSVSERWTGERSETYLLGAGEIRKAVKQFLIYRMLGR